MYKNTTYEQILNRILARVPQGFDKREGSIIYDAVAPISAEILTFYNQLDCLLSDTYADTASENYLIRRCEERGIFRYPPTRAKIIAEFAPDNLNLLNMRFSCDGISFTAISEISNGVYLLECEAFGGTGNVSAGSLVPISNVLGLSSAEITGISSHGEEAEDISALRQRYLESLKAQAFSGNIADYKEKVNSVAGVFGVKVYPAFSGGGTVKLVVINSEFKAPSQILIDNIKNLIDPEDGNGAGLAPIGHTVSVFGVIERNISISFSYTLENDCSYTDLLPFFKKVIDDYFCELSENWCERDYLVLRVSQIESRLLDIPGVLDISALKINGGSSNLTLGADEIPVRGEING